jgi:ATP-dependent Lon protease
MPDGSYTAILHGKGRMDIDMVVDYEPFIRVTYSRREKETSDDENTPEFNAMIDEIKETLNRLNNEIAGGMSAVFTTDNLRRGATTVNYIAAHAPIPLAKKYELLCMNDIYERGMMAIRLLGMEIKKALLRNDIQSKVREDLDQQQREYFLHQQMKTIAEELGGGSAESEAEEMREKSRSKKWSEDIAKTFDKELAKLTRMNPQSPDYSVQRNFLELMLDLPWGEYSKDRFDLKRAQKILDKDHYGLEDVKRRILEYIAVLKLKGDMKAPILCLFGPPGVGKTSLGRSIADAIGRKYMRISLGGLRDEAEIRGHRKTYIGAMPGRIIQSIKKAGVSNPVFVLDEIDKLSQGMQGDPSSAMLEVLDPEQNNTFYDNFLESPYDLSKILFIATANNLSTIQPALLDRMEIIEINGYTMEEKIQIAQRHLLPKQTKEHGMSKHPITISDEVMERLIDGYTRESGVRQLDKKIAQIVRHCAKSLVMKEEYNSVLTFDDVQKILGVPRESDKYEEIEVPGVVTGLAWTAVGGDILFIESTRCSGKGELSMTGNLGQVMKESATIALQYIKSHADEFGIDSEELSKTNIHIHVPEGATPKDGPSAGVTMMTSIVSVLTGRRVRRGIAMTGEITLRGKVLPVGGIKEKILAAKRSGITDIILCEANRKDVEEINQDYLKGLNFHYVSRMSEVIPLALEEAE